jgi:hypothetical protein
MQRVQPIVFAILLVGTSWLAMQWCHELGHVLGAVLTGGTIKRLVLDPSTISSTEVIPNPSPELVVWAGPIVGVLLPVLISAAVPRNSRARMPCWFFAGFCLVANGSYIGIDAFGKTGDGLEMTRTGTPTIAMVLFGLITTVAGFVVWHRLGSWGELFSRNHEITRIEILCTGLILAFLFLAGKLAFPD